MSIADGIGQMSLNDPSGVFDRAALVTIRQRTSSSTQPPLSPQQLNDLGLNNKVVNEEKAVVVEDTWPRIEALLTKISSDNSDSLIKEFISLNIPSNPTHLSKTIDFIYDKVIPTPNLGDIFAKLSKAQIDADIANRGNWGKSPFKNALISRAQLIFQQKQHNVGVIILLGHLFCHGIVSSKIIQHCTLTLFDSVVNAAKKEDIDNASVQEGVQLMGVIGETLDKIQEAKPFLDQWMLKLEQKKEFYNKETLGKVEGLLKLRKNKWVK